MRYHHQQLRCCRTVWTFWALFLVAGRPQACGTSRLLHSAAAETTGTGLPAAAAAAASQPGVLSNQFIVVLHVRSRADATAALARLSQALAAEQPQTGAQAAAASEAAAPFRLLKLLTHSSSGAGPTAAAAAAAGGGSGSSSSSSRQTVLLQMPAATAQLARSLPDVAAVFPDMLITTAAQPAAAAATGPAEDAGAAAAAAGQPEAEQEVVQASAALRQVPGAAACTPAPRKGWQFPSVTYCPDVPWVVPGAAVPRQLVNPSETVPEGLQAIEAVRGGVAASLPNPTAPKKGLQQVTVAVLDSGVDKAHPQLRFVGGRTFGVAASDAYPNDGDAGVDYYRSGTHVAGIVAAKHDGSSVVGVSPGTRVYSLKVMAGNGQGKLSAMLEAVNWLAAEGAAKFGIRVAVLGISLILYPESYFYAQVRDEICASIDALNAAGVLAMAAAGNENEGIRRNFPAACATPLVVTAVRAAASAAGSADGLVSPTAFTNVLTGGGAASAADRDRIIAAPGENVLSIVPTTAALADQQQPAAWTGTSMAAAHVAGVAANCLASGACSLRAPPSVWRAAIVAAAQERATRFSPRFGFRGDPLSPAANGRYYGWLVWSKW